MKTEIIHRLIPRIFVICILASLYNCSHTGSSIGPLLESANTMMKECPDSALSILQGINETDMKQAYRMRYAVLLTEAKYKTYQTPLNDSLISIAAEYYDRDIDNIERLRAYYYKGCVLNENKDHTEAVVALLNAERTGKILKDSYWLGLIYRSIADAYNSLADKAAALDYYKISYEEFRKAQDSKYTDYAIFDVARAYFNVAMYNESIEFAEKAYEQGRKKIAQTLCRQVLGCLGSVILNNIII